MDPVSLAASLITILGFIKSSRETMKGNQQSCIRLCDRLLFFETVLREIMSGTRTDITLNVLQRLQGVIEDAKKMIDKFMENSYWRMGKRFINHSKYAQEFTSLDSRLDSCELDLLLSSRVELEQKQQARRQETIDDSIVVMDGFAQMVIAGDNNIHSCHRLAHSLLILYLCIALLQRFSSPEMPLLRRLLRFLLN